MSVFLQPFWNHNFLFLLCFIGTKISNSVSNIVFMFTRSPFISNIHNIQTRATLILINIHYLRIKTSESGKENTFINPWGATNSTLAAVKSLHCSLFRETRRSVGQSNKIFQWWALTLAFGIWLQSVFSGFLTRKWRAVWVSSSFS